MSWLVFRRVRSSEPTFGEETCPFCHFFIHSFFGVVDDMHLVDAATVVVVVVVVGAFITLFCSSSSSNAVVLILFSRHDSDELEILLNERGSAVSLTYTPLVSKLAPPCNQVEINPDGVTFISKVQYETSTPGMTLPKVLPTSNPQLGLSFFPRAQGGKPIPGATPDRPPIGGPMGFLMKYWYIALPLFIVGMMGPGEEEPAQQQQGGGRAGPSAGGAAAAAAGAGAAAAASGGGGGGVRRRGKRG